MLVKWCVYVDEVNGECYNGVVFNYFCDCKVGDEIMIIGLFGLFFLVFEDKIVNFIFIGMGMGIVFFCVFVKYIFIEENDWKGKICLFYGVCFGLELFYFNDKDGDFMNYYDEDIFWVFCVFSLWLKWLDLIELDKVIEDCVVELFEMLNQVNIYIYVAGYVKVKDNFDKVFVKVLGFKEKWVQCKVELIVGGKWVEVIYQKIN